MHQIVMKQNTMKTYSVRPGVCTAIVAFALKLHLTHCFKHFIVYTYCDYMRNQSIVIVPKRV